MWHLAPSAQRRGDGTCCCTTTAPPPLPEPAAAAAAARAAHSEGSRQHCTARPPFLSASFTNLPCVWGGGQKEKRRKRCFIFAHKQTSLAHSQRKKIDVQQQRVYGTRGPRRQGCRRLGGRRRRRRPSARRTWVERRLRRGQPPAQCHRSTAEHTPREGTAAVAARQIVRVFARAGEKGM